MKGNREYFRELIWPEAMKLKIFNMIHKEQFSRGAKELDTVLITLWSNCETHLHLLLYGDPDKDQYTGSLPSTWNNHLDLPQRMTQMTDPIEWLRELQRDSDPYLKHFDVILEDMQKMYSDQNGNLNWLILSLTDNFQGSNELVRVHAN